MKEWYKINNQTGDIFIYDVIGAWDYSAKQFIEDFSIIEAEEVNLHINSPGGSVFEGLAIYNTIKGSSKNVTVHIDGLCASIASVIACAGDKIVMAENGAWMMHSVSGFADGNSKDLRKQADVMDMLQKNLVQIYADKSGQTADEITALINGIETWMTAAEAKEAGFVDEVIAGQKVAAFADMENYNFKNKVYDNFKTKCVDKPITPKNPQGDRKMLDKILNKLGIESEDQIVSKFTELQESLSAKDVEIESLKSQNSEMQAEKDEQLINLHIAQKKLLPAKKDFAMKMLKTDRDLYNQYIKEEVPEVPTDSLKLEKNTGRKTEIKSFTEILEKPELAEKLQAENPKLYNELYENFIEKGV